jgi:hypothetical protein
MFKNTICKYGKVQTRDDKAMLDDIGKQLGFKELKDWYNITVKQILEKGGKPLLEKYGRSPSRVIISIYDQYAWNEYNFAKKTQRYWHLMGNQRNFMDNLKTKLHFTTMEDWYNINKKDIIEAEGAGLLMKYGDSPAKLVQSVYSEFNWEHSQFRIVRRGPNANYWSQKENRIEFVRQIAHQLQIQNFEDWYRITMQQISQVVPYVTVFRKFPLEKLLVEAYCNQQWDIAKLHFKHGNKSSQRWLYLMVQQLYPQIGDQASYYLIYRMS